MLKRGKGALSSFPGNKDESPRSVQFIPEVESASLELHGELFQMNLLYWNNELSLVPPPLAYADLLCDQLATAREIQCSFNAHSRTGKGAY